MWSPPRKKTTMTIGRGTCGAGDAVVEVGDSAPLQAAATTGVVAAGGLEGVGKAAVAAAGGKARPASFA